MDIISRVYQVILDRRDNPSPDSYVCRLFEKGEDKVLQKLGEEAVETILAAKSGDEDQLVYELTDLLFHSLVLLGAKDIHPRKIAAELERRFGTSGVTEKARRGRD